ncbi:MAG: cytochrome c [Bacteroidota bacterium]
MSIKNYLLPVCTLAIGLMAASCTRDPNDTGTEYAPQMYHSIPYEPYTQVVDTASEFYNTIPYNNEGNDKSVIRSNQRKPVKGTVFRRFYSGQLRTEVAKELYIYDNIPADSFALAGRVLKSPLAHNEGVLKEGEVLYGRYCKHCHGAEGKGDGKVAPIYKGVPTGYNAGAYANMPEGHIFHVITHGKGRMYPHGSQVNPEDRWKIVQFVQTLQKLPQ